jgi:hypothetical protein
MGIRRPLIGNLHGVIIGNDPLDQFMLFHFFQVPGHRLRRDTGNTFLDVAETLIAYTHRNDDRQFPFSINYVQRITNRFYSVQATQVRFLAAIKSCFKIKHFPLGNYYIK